MKRGIRILLIVIVSAFIALAVPFIYSRPWQHALFMEPLHHLPAEEKVIALTFDDGPSPIRTPALLDLLKEADVKATFFMLGQKIQRYPEIAQRVYDEGHLMGNHSYDHSRLIFKSPGFIKRQVAQTDQMISSLGQEEIIYMRPPNAKKYITLPLVLQSMNKTLVTGSYDPPSEYNREYNGTAVANEVISNVEPGAIVFLHDGMDRDREEFVRSVELIIRALKEQGYSFVRLDYTP